MRTANTITSVVHGFGGHRVDVKLVCHTIEIIVIQGMEPEPIIKMRYVLRGPCIDAPWQAPGFRLCRGTTPQRPQVGDFERC